MRHVKTFFLLLLVYAVITAVVSWFTSLALSDLTNTGTTVGAIGLLLGGWRVLSPSSPAIEEIAFQQRLDEFSRDKRETVGGEPIRVFLPSGPLFFSGLAWVVFMQAARYGLAA